MSCGLWVQDVASSTLVPAAYPVGLILTDVFTVLQGAASSTPGVAPRFSLPPHLENNFQLDRHAQRKARDAVHQAAPPFIGVRNAIAGWTEYNVSGQAVQFPKLLKQG